MAEDSYNFEIEIDKTDVTLRVKTGNEELAQNIADYLMSILTED